MGHEIFLTPCWFSFNNSFKLSNFSLQTFMSNFVSLTHPRCQILDKTQTDVFTISRFMVMSLINKNCHNSRRSNDIDMKLEPVDNYVCQQIVTSPSFFQFTVDIEQSGTWILDSWSILLISSLIATFVLTHQMVRF